MGVKLDQQNCEYRRRTISADAAGECDQNGRTPQKSRQGFGFFAQGKV